MSLIILSIKVYRSGFTLHSVKKVQYNFTNSLRTPQNAPAMLSEGMCTEILRFKQNVNVVYILVNQDSVLATIIKLVLNA